MESNYNTAAEDHAGKTEEGSNVPRVARGPVAHVKTTKRKHVIFLCSTDGRAPFTYDDKS